MIGLLGDAQIETKASLALWAVVWNGITGRPMIGLGVLRDYSFLMIPEGGGYNHTHIC
jgi:hypothetical protein